MKSALLATSRIPRCIFSVAQPKTMPYARFDNFGRGGFNPDSYETGLDPGQWSEMYNADIFNGDLYACGEEVVRFTDCPFQILYSHVFLTENRSLYVASDGLSVAAYVNGSWEVFLTGLDGGLVTFSEFFGSLIINSISSGPYYWVGLSPPPSIATWADGAGTSWTAAGIYQWNSLEAPSAAALPGWPAGATCVQVVAFGNYLVAVGVNDPSGDGSSAEPYLVWWSDAAPPGAIPSVWTPAVDNAAGDFLLQDTGGPITGAHKLRDNLIVYKSDSIYRMFETFDPDTVMAYERVVSRPSIDSPYGVTEYGEVHYCISKAGIFVFDGQQAQQIDYDRVHGAILALSTFESFDRIQVVANQQDSEIWFAFRDIGSGPLTTVLKYSIPYNAFCAHLYGGGLTSITAGQYEESDSTRTWENPPAQTWADGAGIPWRDPTLRGDLVDRVFLAENNTVRTYEPLRGGRVGVSARPTELLRYGIRFSDPTKRTMLRALYPEMEAGGSVTFQVGIQHQPWRSYDAALPQITWGAEREFRPGTDIEIPLCDVGAVYALRIKSRTDSQATDQFWRLHAVGFRFDTLGDYG
jgi:hypothetical protein